MTKRILSLLLAVLLIATLMPASAFAASNTFYINEETGDDSNAGTQSEPFQTLTKALEAAGSDQTTIILLHNLANTNGAKIGTENGSLNQNIILDLHSFEICDSSVWTSLFTVYQNSILTINDTSEGKTGKIIATSGKTRCIENYGTLNFNGGTITGDLTNGDNETYIGAGVLNKGTLNMASGTIANCKTNYDGAAIYNEGTCDLSLAVFSNNTANRGGAIYTKGFVGFSQCAIGECTANLGGAVYAENGSRFETSRGLIEKCKATGENACGGAVYVEHGATATFANDITINNCQAAKDGGAIYSDGVLGIETCTISENTVTAGNGAGIYLASQGRAFIGKAAKINSNKKDAADNNLYVSNGALLTVGTGIDVPAPEQGMDVHISSETEAVLDVPVEFFTNGSAKDQMKFVSDKSNEFVCYDSLNKRLKLVVIEDGSHEITVVPREHGYIGVWKYARSGDITFPVVPDRGYELDKFYIDDVESALTCDKDGNITFEMPDRDVTLSATFKPVTDPIAKINNVPYASLKAAFDDLDYYSALNDTVYLCKDLDSSYEIVMPELSILDLDHHTISTESKIENYGSIILYQENADIIDYLLFTLQGMYGSGERISVPNTDNPDYVIPADTFFSYAVDEEGAIEMGFVTNDELVIWNHNIPAGSDFRALNGLVLKGDILSSHNKLEKTMLAVYELELADNITVGSNDENDSEAALEIWTPIEGFYGIKANGKKITINKTGKVVVEAGAKINESVFVSGVAGMNVCKQFDKDENTTTYYLDYVRHNSSGSKTKSKTKEETEDNTMLNFCVDVKKGDACYDAVLWAYLNNICKGTDNVHFSPNATVNRAQAITFLWRAAGSPVVNYAMNMKDVDADSYYGEAVRWALSEGITKGISENQFGPDSTCTQVQIETLLARLANANDDIAGKEYIDVQKNPCTRAEAVMYLYKQLAK